MLETVLYFFVNVYAPENVYEHKDSTYHKIKKFNRRKLRLHMFQLYRLRVVIVMTYGS